MINAGMRPASSRRLALRGHPASDVVQRAASSAWMERVCDFLVACAILAFTLPLMAIIALVIKCESPGAVLERQARVIIDGRRFDVLRFRSTVQRRGENVRSLSGPEITRAGRFLVHTRIAELPQLINVLRGEMTFFRSDLPRVCFLDLKATFPGFPMV